MYPNPWKLAVLFIGILFLIIGVYQTLNSYFALSLPVERSYYQLPILHIVSDSNSPIFVVEGNLTAEQGFYRNKPIQIKLEVNTSRISNYNISEVDAILIPNTISQIDNMLADKVLSYYPNQRMILRKASINDTWFYGENVFKFSNDGTLSILLILRNPNNAILTAYIVPNQVVIHGDSALLQAESLKQDIRNGLRIEGLTWVGVGFAIIMFLTEIRIKE